MSRRISAKSLLSRWPSSPARIPALQQGQLLANCEGERWVDDGSSRQFPSHSPVDVVEQHFTPWAAQVGLANEWSSSGGLPFSWRSGCATVITPRGYPLDFSNPGAMQTKKYSAGDAMETRGPSCWSCEYDLSAGTGLSCPSCNAVQPVNPALDYFQIFEIDRAFDVERKSLEQKYKNLQKRLHPDLVASRSQKEQDFSAEQSAHVIQAYYILLRPLSRARYLLGLHGVKVEEEGTIDDPDLLMEIMEIRESIEDVSDAGKLGIVQAENNERISRCEKELDSYFKANDLKLAVSGVQRLAYYNKIGEEILRKL